MRSVDSSKRRRDENTGRTELIMLFNFERDDSTSGP